MHSLISRKILAFGCGIALLATPREAKAYGVDVHFTLTYVLCRLSGMEAIDAAWVAAANQSMDDNDCTSAYRDGLWYVNHRDLSWRNGKLFHMFSDANKKYGSDIAPYFVDGSLKGKSIEYTDGGAKAREELLARLVTLKKRIPRTYGTEDERIMADIAFGQYLHAQQDWFSHRQFSKEQEDDKAFLPYGPIAGHSAEPDGSCADYVAVRPHLATAMARNSVGEIAIFLQNHGRSAKSIPETELISFVHEIARTYRVEDADRNLDKQFLVNATSPVMGVSPPEFEGRVVEALDRIGVVAKCGGKIPAYDPVRGPAWGEDSLKLPYDKPGMSLNVLKERFKKVVGQ